MSKRTRLLLRENNALFQLHALAAAAGIAALLAVYLALEAKLD